MSMGDTAVAKGTYENVAALADALPKQWRGLYAEIIRTLIISPAGRSGANRWLKDAGYGRVHNYETGS